MILEAQEPGNPKNRSLDPEPPAPRTRKSPDADAPLGSMLAPKNPRRAPSLVRTEEKVVVWERHREQPSREPGDTSAQQWRNFSNLIKLFPSFFSLD